LLFVILRGQREDAYQDPESAVTLGIMEGLGLWESRNFLLGDDLGEIKSVMGMI
jgi:hypothetical protein